MSNQQGWGAALVAMIALGVGWGIGRTTTLDIAAESRIASLERDLASLKQGTAGQGIRPAGAPIPGQLAGAQGRRPDPNVRYEIALAGAPALGPEKAKITIVEFSDFQCPFCARSAPMLKQIHEAYPDQVRVVFKNLPLRMHANARAAALAAEAARQQGKFWEMHDKIFANQSAMNPEQYEKYAQELGLDLARFRKDLAASSSNERIAADEKEAEKVGVTGTPSFFINGKFQPGALPFDVFKAIIDEELKKAS